MRFIALATATAFLGLASLAFAAEVSRPEYKAAVEPICKANTKANERILKGVRSTGRSPILTVGSRQKHIHTTVPKYPIWKAGCLRMVRGNTHP
jgi:hypothetical protein